MLRALTIARTFKLEPEERDARACAYERAQASLLATDPVGIVVNYLAALAVNPVVALDSGPSRKEASELLQEALSRYGEGPMLFAFDAIADLSRNYEETPEANQR